jgi:bifunctional non-homologous end joining protein LigD
MPDGLSEYRRKRGAERTPEPYGGDGTSRPGMFVVQLHDATRLHYDFRLEMGGTLKSWAVPRGPSYDPAEKRMAVHVEDHPVEYADFEGVIPDGEYGAGPSICWDRGRWVALEDPVKGLEKGKLLFRLYGYKLKGEWTLVRTARNPKDWLLIKHKDAFAKKGGVPLVDRSIFSNLTPTELLEAKGPPAQVRAELARLAPPKKALEPGKVDVMLAEAREKAFTAPGWLFEIKYDGFRVLAFTEKGRVQLRFRRGRDVTELYPELVLALSKLTAESLVLDGEVVVLDEENRPSFQRMQRRSQLTRAVDIERAVLDLPVAYFAFDLLGFEGQDLRGLPLRGRKALLKTLIPQAGPVRVADHFEERGEALFEQVERLGFEGVMAKKADAPYRAGRSDAWLKIATHKSADFVIVGFTEPEGPRIGFSGLQLAAFEGKELVYCGSVGSGFDDEQLEAFRTELDTQRRETAPCAGSVPKQKGQVWVEPTRVCEVRFKGVTEDGLLRAPVFVRMREDKAPSECPRPPPSGRLPEPPEPTPAERHIPFSNLDKVFWPEDGYKKGDLIEYYRGIAPWLLPYLKDRPVVLTRFPDGIHGKSFFQKDAPEFVPAWIRREVMWSEDTQRDIHHFVCNDADSLLYLVNLGTIPLHVWSSRVTSLPQPDWCIVDLDPKDAPFTDVVKVALAMRALADDIELPCYVKTTGSSGLHVLFPLGKQLTHRQSTSLAELISRVIAAELPQISTVARAMGERAKRVYLDYLQNGQGKLIASTFCVRPLPTAPVSMPLKWSEVTPRLTPRQFTIANARARLEELGEDPFAPVLVERPDLPRALARLSERQAKG